MSLIRRLFNYDLQTARGENVSNTQQIVSHERFYNTFWTTVYQRLTLEVLSINKRTHSSC